VGWRPERANCGCFFHAEAGKKGAKPALSDFIRRLLGPYEIALVVLCNTDPQKEEKKGNELRKSNEIRTKDIGSERSFRNRYSTGVAVVEKDEKNCILKAESGHSICFSRVVIDHRSMNISKKQPEAGPSR
jgi:hypothetical protein